MISTDKKDEYSEFLTTFSAVFESLTTEKQCMSFLRKENLYKDPVLFTVDESVIDTVQHRKLILAKKKSTVARMDITFIFQSFFELPGVFEACKRNTDSLQSENGGEISNIIQGSAWKKRKILFGDM